MADTENQTHQAILWLDGRRIMDDIFPSYDAAKIALDTRQTHYMEAYGHKLANFDRMVEKRV